METVQFKRLKFAAYLLMDDPIKSPTSHVILDG